MSEETPQYAGVPMRHQDVRFAVSSGEAVAASRSHRLRMLDLVGDLAPEEWAQQSRCSEWSVQDVVRHLTHVGTLQLESVAAARSGERFHGFAAGTFDPKVTPVTYLQEAGAQGVDATLADFARTTNALLDLYGEIASTAPSDLLVSTPAGRQPWDRAVLHALFDSAVHERDILVALPERAAPAPPADEVRAIASYQVLLVARILAVVGAPVDLALELRGGPSLHVVVAGPLVSVLPLEDGAAPAARASGDVAAVLDAMTGRGAVADVLDGPPEVAMGLSALASLV